MKQQLHLDSYKQAIADWYSRRSPTYDQGDWHPLIAHRLIEYAQIKPGQQILDIATGTGLVAITAAQLVGVEGRVVGVDISLGMLEEAQRKITALGLKNIELILADAESLDLPNNSFDVVLCSSALIWMADITAALRLWYQFIKPGGIIGFHAFAETAFIQGVVARKVATNYGISLEFSRPTGTIEKCHNLLHQAGFVDIEITCESDGDYISLEQATQMWPGNSQSLPGQFPNPLSQLSATDLAQIKTEFESELAALTTKQGIWNDRTIFYSLGRKPI